MKRKLTQREFATRLKAAQERTRISNREIARRLQLYGGPKVGADVLSDYRDPEYEHGPPRVEVRRALEKAIGIPAGELDGDTMIIDVVAEGTVPYDGTPKTDYTQLPEDEVLGLLQFDRPGFVRYLQRVTGGPVPTPISAKLGFLDFVERIAKEKGIAVDTAEIEALRIVIRGRFL